ncbi:MetQ/NlpA family ABC transporter substrate-binding protein [Paenibacillus glycanilyticus]|uniref:MetQ/NlpA family ABC transporter substrate-binding protein n=1 Tax=Paenibacillus glycanilyticus TaxID=126569 RepID=UPI00203FE4F1|nr:MetQ/NlpA family ABC transporter substrate-binding protein [Paenibacillus glycanilyticus]MCM3627402.1 MetQ/NlpA family ABC transporter substrate-binding protein [Paenibacillus glycanilyticus]
MKKFGFILLALTLVIALSACGAKKEENNASAGNGNDTVKEVTLKVGATPVPHAEILNFIKPALKEQGINLEVVEFNDYVQPNTQLYEKQLDANFFQHTPYLDQFNKDKGYDLVSVAGVHIEPMGAYSKKVKSADELKDGAKVVIPNDPTNGGRALQLLAANNLIKLKDGVGVAATVHDITENPKNLKITEVEAATLPRVLGEVDLALINSNFALEADLTPTKDALFIEGSDSPYVNILVTRPDNKDSEAIKKLAAALQTPDVKKFIEDTYAGAIVPAFE